MDSFRPFEAKDIGAAGSTKSKPADDIRDFDNSEGFHTEKKSYAAVKESFDKKKLSKKDERFFLSELVAGQMSVEEEEQRRFAKRLEEELERRVNAIKEEAHKLGYDDGLKKGVDKAYNEEKAQIAARMEQLAVVINDLQGSKEKLQEDLEKRLTNYVFEVASIIVESEIQNRPECVTTVVGNILAFLSKEEDVKIKLSLITKNHVEYIKQEIGKLSRKGSYVIEFDESLDPGDAIIESSNGVVSARVQERLEKFRKEINVQLEEASEEAS